MKSKLIQQNGQRPVLQIIYPSGAGPCEIDAAMAEAMKQHKLQPGDALLIAADVRAARALRWRWAITGQADGPVGSNNHKRRTKSENKSRDQ